ncbi:MAG TPA: four helix bundle protein [Roseimicrobium sp.]|nr:four helix bundle protein [Roseimicrobium sp.]
MAIQTYRDLLVWKRAMQLVEVVYRLSAEFPADERYGLKSQVQRAAVSVPANIAEGYGRTHRGDYLHHLSIARGSLMEVETHLALAARLKLVSRDDVMPCWEIAQKVGQLLNKLIVSL